MKFKKPLSIVFAMTIIFVGAFSVEALAFGKHHRHDFGLEILTDPNLHLTGDQTAQILNILATYKNDRQKAMVTLRAARKSLRTALQTAWKSTPPSEGDIQSTYQTYYSQVAPVKAELFVARAKMMASLKGVLNEDQKKLLKERWAQKLEKKIAEMQSRLQRLQSLQSKMSQ
jgi:hypothetical protein